MSRKPKSFWVCVAVAVISLSGFLVTCHALPFLALQFKARATFMIEMGAGSIVLSGDSSPSFDLYFGRVPVEGFIWLPQFDSFPSRWIYLVIPLWIPFLIASIATVVIYQRSARAQPGICRACRYDLTANTSGVCPECGTKANS